MRKNSGHAALLFDDVIAVKERVEAPGFGPWTIKAGVQHVFPPTNVLRDMLTVRVHLDACDESSGALKVIPSTHRGTLLSDADFNRLAREVGVITCSVERGDAVVMRPLIAHASERADKPSNRRVIHIEFAARPLPAPLSWNQHVSLRRRAL